MNRSASSGIKNHQRKVDLEARLWNDLDLEESMWMVGAACTDTDPEAFFAFESSADIKMLKRICFACDVRQQCLDYALKHNVFGYWGGTSRFERRRMLKEAS